MPERVSVQIINYQTPDYLEECIDSVIEDAEGSGFNHKWGEE